MLEQDFKESRSFVARQPLFLLPEFQPNISIIWHRTYTHVTSKSVKSEGTYEHLEIRSYHMILVTPSSST